MSTALLYRSRQWPPMFVHIANVIKLDKQDVGVVMVGGNNHCGQVLEEPGDSDGPSYASDDNRVWKLNHWLNRIKL